VQKICILPSIRSRERQLWYITFIKPTDPFFSFSGSDQSEPQQKKTKKPKKNHLIPFPFQAVHHGNIKGALAQIAKEKKGTKAIQA
jgi:hypothetical protein